MALGGGKFTVMNKKLPGTYVNVTTKPSEYFGLESGIVAIPFCLNWEADAKIIEITAEDWLGRCWDLLGYTNDASALKQIREIFAGGATKVLVYNLNVGTKASNTYATAKYKGTRGNDIKIKIQTNVEDSSKFDVITLVDNMDMDVQTVATAAGLEENDWVEFDSSATLAANVTAALSGGTNGTVTGTQHMAALTTLEQQYFNVLICDSVDTTTKLMYVNYVKRMRDAMGKCFQLIIYRQPADYEGVINVYTSVSDAGAAASSLVYWVGGKTAACSLGKSLTNVKYDGEFSPVCEESQSALEASITSGYFMFHLVGEEERVLMDINSLTTFTDEKSSLMTKNEIIRTVDYLNNNIADLFNTRYIGKVINSETGRAHLRQDIAAIQDKLVQAGVIQYEGTDLTVALGPDKGDVVISDIITVNAAMIRLYVTIEMN